MKDFFPDWKTSVGTVVMVAIGVMVWNVVNSRFRIESKVEQALPKKNNMKTAA